MFDKIKQALEFKKKMDEIKKQLDLLVLEVESKDKTLKVVITGSQEIKEIKIQGQITDTAKFEKTITETVNKAIRESQQTAAKKMTEISGFNIPGLT